MLTVPTLPRSCPVSRSGSVHGAVSLPKAGFVLSALSGLASWGQGAAWMSAQLEKSSLGLWLGLSVWLLSLTGCYLGFGATPLPPRKRTRPASPADQPELFFPTMCQADA